MISGMLILQVSHFLGRICYLLFSLWYLNQYLGVAAKGSWTAFYGLVSILGVGANMGYEVWLTRAVAGNGIGAKQAKKQLFQLKGITWLIALIVGFIYVRMGQHPIALAIPFGLVLVLDGIAVSQQAVFEGLSKAKAMAIMSLLKSAGFVLLAAMVALLVPNPRLELFAWMFVLALGIRVIYGLKGWRALPPDRPYLGSHWRECILMGAWALATVVYFSMDTVMLYQMTSDIETGYYGNAYNFVEGSLFISAALGAMLYPRLIQARSEQRGVLFDRAFGLAMVIAACGVIALNVIGVPLGRWLAGEAFVHSEQLLFMLAWCLPFMFGNGLLGRWLMAHHRESFALKTAIVGALLNVIGNAWAIPRYGPAGAAVMTLITEGGLFFVWALWGRKSWGILIWWATLMLVASAVLMCLLAWDLPLVGYPLAIGVLLPAGLWSAKRLDQTAKQVVADA